MVSIPYGVDVGLVGLLLGLHARRGEPPVPGREPVHLLGEVHQHVRPVHREPALVGRGHVGLLNRLHRRLVTRHERLAVCRLGHLRPGLDDDGFEVLRPHHRAGAPAAGGPVVLVDDAGVAHLVLAAGTDRHRREVLPVGAVDLGLDGVDGVVDAVAPEVAGVTEFDLAVLDHGVDGLVGPSLEQQAVEAGPLEPGAAPAAVVGVGDGVGQG